MAVSEDKGSNEKKQRRELFRLISVASTVGIQIVLSTFIGLAIGYFLDEHLLPKFLPFNTSPWFTIIFLLIGIAAGFKYLFRVALRQQDNGDSEQGN
jgi:ATP synthase protein I